MITSDRPPFLSALPRSLIAAMARLMACLALLSASTAAAPAQKTDVVTFTNGDQITCDIKELVHGRLRVKTDTMETVYVRWLPFYWIIKS